MGASEKPTLKALCLALVFGTAAPDRAAAQEATPQIAPGAAPGQETLAVDPGEIDALLESIRILIDGVNTTKADTDAAMTFLSDQVEAAIRELTTREFDTEELRETTRGLTDELQAVASNRDELGFQVTRLTEEKDAILARLQGQVRDLETNLRASLQERDRAAADLSQTRVALATRQAQSEHQLRRLAALEKDIAALHDGRAALEKDITELRDSRAALESRLSREVALMETTRASLDAARARNRELDHDLSAASLRNDALSDELVATAAQGDGLKDDLTVSQSQTEALDRQLVALRAQLAELNGLFQTSQDAYKVIEADKEKIQAQLQDVAILQSLRDDLVAKLARADSDAEAQKELGDEAQAQVQLLNRQVLALRQQLASLATALDAAEAANEEQDVHVADLGRRLNLALASKVKELARYRSEFLGRLRTVLDQRADVRVVGDRFVFQSEVLFATGEAELEAPGRAQLLRLGESLKEIGGTIPGDIDWVLRVDGHTDERPIQTPRFPSNWELSTARAISVVRFLIDQGVPAERVMAAGFAHFRPLDPGGNEAALRRNRRIEFRLTQK